MKKITTQYRTLLTTVLLSLICHSAVAFKAPETWTKPYPAFRVIGNLYGVGTHDLSAFFIPTSEGHILINTGLEGSDKIIKENIESLGYKMEDIKILLTQQAHFDHTASLADIQTVSGAEMWATMKDARVLEDGGFSDPHFGGTVSFKPIKVDKILKDGDLIRLGGTRLTVHLHPGHTEGSSSYTMEVTENGKTYRVVIANMGSINEGKKLTINPTYPGAGADFAYTYLAQKSLPIDVWVAAHGSQYGLHNKYKPGQAYSPDTFVDPEGFIKAIEILEGKFLEVVASERIK